MRTFSRAFLLTPHLDDGLRAYYRTDAAPGAFLSRELCGVISQGVVAVGELDRTFRTILDTITAGLAHLLVNDNSAFFGFRFCRHILWLFGFWFFGLWFLIAGFGLFKPVL